MQAREAHSSAGQTDFISDISTAEVPTEQGAGDPCLTSPLLPLQDPTKMGPGLDHFLLLHLKRGDRDPGAGLASCSFLINPPVLSLPCRIRFPSPAPRQGTLAHGEGQL